MLKNSYRLHLSRNWLTSVHKLTLHLSRNWLTSALKWTLERLELHKTTYRFCWLISVVFRYLPRFYVALVIPEL